MRKFFRNLLPAFVSTVSIISILSLIPLACGGGSVSGGGGGAGAPVTGVTLDKTALSLAVGQSEALGAKVLPSNARDKGTSWQSSDTGVVTVTPQGTIGATNGGLVRALAVGTATITATTRDGGFTAGCTVTVGPGVPVTGVTLNKTETSIPLGGTETLQATVLPANATNKGVSWDSSDINTVAVDSGGVVTARAMGSAVISVTCDDGGLRAECNVTVTSANIHAAGSEGGHASLWINGAAALLLGNDQSRADSVFVSGPSIYAAGYEYDAQGRQLAMLWVIDRSTTNTTARTLSSQAGQTGDGVAGAVFVAGGDVYVAGHEYIQGKAVATLWKNNDAPRRLSNAADGAFGDAFAHSVFVSGADVYVVGAERFHSRGKDVATLWKNGAATRLSREADGAYGDARAHSVFVSGSDVYVAGAERVHSRGKDVATLWKNGAATRLSREADGAYGDARAHSVFVSGGGARVVGFETQNLLETAMLWPPTGSAQSLGQTPSLANAVFVLGNDVYVAGTENGSAIVWKNGSVHWRVAGAEAMSLFVD